MSKEIQKIIKNSKHPAFIKAVFEFAKEKYGDKKMSSGEEYMAHTTSVAGILDSMHLDQKTIAAGILHDILEINPLAKEESIEEITKKFGSDVAMIVERFSEVKRIYFSFNLSIAEEFFAKEKIENVRKMFLAIAKDLRVILIELASRIDRLNHIQDFPLDKQKLYATETLQVFVPIANRLGLGEIKTRLEDMAFAYLLPKEFALLQEHIKEKYEERQRYLKKFIPHLKKIFKQEKIRFQDINYRAKSYWSTYQKAKKYDMNFERVRDLVALRIIVPDVATCYKALGIIHKYYQPISEEINDYIAKPKTNGYKSLHTTVFLEKGLTAQEGKISEIQIKTEQMHQEAEYGVCAHWSYKEKIDLQKEKGNYEWTKEIPEFWNTFKIDFFENQIFVFTPKGDIKVLPKGSTPIDFAYAIHSDVGNHCESAKIGGKIIPLSQELKNGDVVEILINKKRLPSLDWLKFIKTNFAKSYIKKLTAEYIASSIFNIPTFIKEKITGITEQSKKRREESNIIKKEKPSQIYLAGQKGMLVHIAKCCSPKSTDQVKAYLTKYRAAVLHNTSCENLKKLSQAFPEKIIDATWRQS